MAGIIKKPKVFVAMSGGVDSSVAALLLKKQGYKLVGCFIKGWYPPEFPCAWREERRDAMRVCAKLNIPFITINAEKEYKQEVVDYMLNEYKTGRTPNPDVMCNKTVKFGLFLKKALEMGADYIATGHYVRLAEHPARCSCRNSGRDAYSLYIAKDQNKDQSYFLWALTQDQLKHCLFPIGDYTKPQVRVLAKKFGLHNADKKDSQGICFLGKIAMADFLKKYIREKRGTILNASGERLGEHKGAYFYTIGQRHGLNIGRRPRRFIKAGIGTLSRGIVPKLADIKPYYVADKDVNKNIVVVAEGEGHPALYKKEVLLTNINFVLPERGQRTSIIPAMVRVRYRQPLQKAKLFFPRRSAFRSASVRVVFDKPIKFVASGQSAVFYNSRGEMLGGGIIKSAK